MGGFVFDSIDTIIVSVTVTVFEIFDVQF